MLWIIFSMQPKRLSEDPFYPVSYNSPSNFSAYTNANSTVFTVVVEKNYAEPITVQPRTMPVDCIKIPGFF